MTKLYSFSDSHPTVLLESVDAQVQVEQWMIYRERGGGNEDTICKTKKKTKKWY